MFSKQLMFCNTCGGEFRTRFDVYDGRFCCSDCQQEYVWRQTLSALGKPYRANHSVQKEKEPIVN